MLTYLNPFTWARWAGDFFFRYVLTVPWRKVPYSMPAILVLVAIAIGLSVSRAGLAGWRSTRVANLLADAWRNGDYETAELLLRRQLDERPGDAELLYKFASLRDERGAKEEAIGRMRELVATRRHPGAARWLIQHAYENRNWQKMEEMERAEFGAVLTLAHEASPQDLALTQLVAEFQLLNGNLPRAAELFEQLASAQPLRGLQAAVLSRQLGSETTAIRLATRTLEEFEKRVQAEPTNFSLHVVRAQCQLFLNRHADALKSLEQAGRQTKEPEQAAQVNQAIGDVIVAWIAHIEQSEEGKGGDRTRVLRMLQVALQYAPNNPRVLTLVCDQVLKSHDDSDESVVALREALVAGTSPGISHFIQGTAAMLRDDIAAAEMHLKVASELLPKSGAILNNLAVAMASRPDANLDQALKISQASIDQTPGATPHFYETRGQILVKLERHLDAVPDLERALAAPELAPAAHASLAVCYDKLGQAGLAEMHRKKATEAGGVGDGESKAEE